MKDFLLTYVIVLTGVVVFAFFGGLLIFDFSNNAWLAIASCSLVISIVVFAFVRLSSKVEELEERLSKFESEKKDG